MRFLWLAIIVVTAAPLVYVGMMTNPIVFLVLGPDGWRERMLRLRPHRRRIAFLAAVCAFSATVYILRYG